MECKKLIEDEEVSLVDGVLEGALGALEALEMEALVDAMDVDSENTPLQGMVIKDLDLEPKIDAMMRDFLDPSRWKELSKESGSKIIQCGDGSGWKAFKPIASLIA
ncbi:hypothetical protein Tco_1320417 [Tanacetum coccineum]